MNTFFQPLVAFMTGKSTPRKGRGVDHSVSEACAFAHSYTGAINEASQELRSVLLLESVLLHAIAQPPLDGVVGCLDGRTAQAQRLAALGS